MSRYPQAPPHSYLFPLTVHSLYLVLNLRVMERISLRPFFSLLTGAMLLSGGGLAQDNIALHPQNPHYFIYKNKPTLLITSGEHYGAVVNLDFNYKTYFATLKADGLNLTRIFTGAYIEPQGAFNIASNTLAPASEKFIAPWPRSSQPGYAPGGNRFDLAKWNPRYFKRLRAFTTAARKAGVIVELAFFCPFYKDDQWAISPMNNANNINGVGDIPKDDVYTLDKNGGLLQVQQALVRKIVEELKTFDNVIYEICNEPYFGGVTMEWQHNIADVIRETEEKLGVRHLISQNIANGSERITNPHPDVSVFNFHYASPPDAVAQNYHLNKVIGDNETGFKGTDDLKYRMEAWEFILAGGALYNNLDYSFTVGHEKGTFVYPSTQPGGGTKALRSQLRFLKEFMDKFDFIQMAPDSTLVSGLPDSVRVRILAETGKQYAVYIFGAGLSQLTMQLPEGEYEAEWLDPIAGKYTLGRVVHHGGLASIAVPPYGSEYALRLIAKAGD